jgi:hypothetical protein
MYNNQMSLSVYKQHSAQYRHAFSCQKCIQTELTVRWQSLGVVKLFKFNYRFLTPKEKVKVTFNTFMRKMNSNLPQNRPINALSLFIVSYVA